MDDKNLTVEEAAKFMNVAKSTIWTWCKQNKLPAFKLPGSRRWQISKRDLEKLLRDLKKNQYENT